MAGSCKLLAQPRTVSISDRRSLLASLTTVTCIPIQALECQQDELYQHGK